MVDGDFFQTQHIRVFFLDEIRDPFPVGTVVRADREVNVVSHGLDDLFHFISLPF
ncbi:hypothetical protein SDC9_179041 [bioreactor metagenome]|uniref:Uncharacterized protein n=1 Tax=bioreactor metagenome TaxID=1076179 RepID=A0A645GXV4_9ZZZZ